MKLPKHLTAALLIESPTFRDHIVGLLYGDEMRGIVTRAVETADGKIDAIKKVRQLAQDHPIEFQMAFPSIEMLPATSTYRIGLADSKRFVESLRDFDLGL